MTEAVGGLDGVRRLLERPEFEVLPFSSVLEQVDFLPENATVTVTVSPAKGIEPTIRYAVELARRGFEVTPHLAAHSFQDRAHLAGAMATLEEAGIRRVFVIGGDAQQAGEFPDALSLIQAMEAMGEPMPAIGIAAYPDGHAFIPDDVLLQALKDKQPYASYMTTQMCFDPELISRWVRHVRDEDIMLPIRLGMPGVAPLTKLAGIAARIGVGDSVRFLAKHKGLLPALVGRGNYAPDELVAGLEAIVADPAAGVEGLHFYTFNQFESCESWRQDFLAAIEG
jgi:methylenetetrahydrofolate reductase (NADH)